MIFWKYFSVVLRQSERKIKPMANFGERIKELRKQRGLTQRQMAQIFEITERNYQRYESTDSPSNETLVKLAKFFEVSTDYLIGQNTKKIEFAEPLESYATWLRKVGINISGGSESGIVVVEVADDEYYEISANADAILKMSKEHFALLTRQLGKKWPFENNEE
jgi:transcriptional regulator with XRE-family HTH domain